MMDLVLVFFVGWGSGLVLLAANLSPYFAALCLMAAAGFGCGILVIYGASFLSLVLFLIYLGGMLVVFAYTAALAAEPYPGGLFERSTLLNVGFYVAVLFTFYWWGSGGGEEGVWLGLGGYEVIKGFDGQGGFHLGREDVEGVSSAYGEGQFLLFFSAWGLFVTLLVVLELTRGGGRGGLRAP